MSCHSLGRQRFSSLPFGYINCIKGISPAFMFCDTGVLDRFQSQMSNSFFKGVILLDKLLHTLSHKDKIPLGSKYLRRVYCLKHPNHLIHHEQGISTDIVHRFYSTNAILDILMHIQGKIEKSVIFVSYVLWYQTNHEVGTLPLSFICQGSFSNLLKHFTLLTIVTFYICRVHRFQSLCN